MDRSLFWGRDRRNNEFLRRGFRSRSRVDALVVSAVAGVYAPEQRRATKKNFGVIFQRVFRERSAVDANGGFLVRDIASDLRERTSHL